MSTASSYPALIEKLEKIIHQDPGKRGLEAIWNELEANGQQSRMNTLLDAAQSLVSSCKKAIVATGFILPIPKQPETDGPPGALAICRALHFMGREVSLITAPGNADVLKASIEFEKKLHGYDIPLIVAPLISDAVDINSWVKETLEGVDHVISIEILGAATDGKYYNMRGIDATEFNAPIDVLFGPLRGSVKRISIGDGGNEIGMGNLYDMVCKHVPRGEIICSRSECDQLISTGVSNWGGYAIAFAAYLILKSKGDAPVAMLPTAQGESDLLDVLLESGALDGPTNSRARKVDSFDFELHAKLIEDMHSVCSS